MSACAVFVRVAVPRRPTWPGLMEEAVRHAMPCVSTQRCGWHPVNLTGNVEVQGVHYDARVFYYFAARFLTYINGVR